MWGDVTRVLEGYFPLQNAPTAQPPCTSPSRCRDTDLLPTVLVSAQMTAGTGCSMCRITHPPRTQQRELFQIDRLCSEGV